MSCTVLINDNTLYNISDCTVAVGSKIGTLDAKATGDVDIYTYIHGRFVLTSQTSLSNLTLSPDLTVLDFNDVTYNTYYYEFLLIPAIICAFAVFWFIYKMIFGARHV